MATLRHGAGFASLQSEWRNVVLLIGVCGLTYEESLPFFTSPSPQCALLGTAERPRTRQRPRGRPLADRTGTSLRRGRHLAHLVSSVAIPESRSRYGCLPDESCFQLSWTREFGDVRRNTRFPPTTHRTKRTFGNAVLLCL